MSQILKNLYLGDIESARSLEKNNHFDFVVLSCAIEADTKYDYKINLYDGKNENTKILFNNAVDFIKHNLDNNKKILVHCMAGVSRSASVVIYYLMKHEYHSYDSAYKLVKSSRPIINPNIHFIKFLENHKN